jgi:membrane-bound lytic murein transglycosylase B
VNDDDDFALLMRGEATDVEKGPIPSRGPGRALVAAIVATGLVGLAVVTAGLVVGGLPPEPRAATPVAAATADPRPAPATVDAVDASETSIAALADPAWLDDFSARSGIPRRALAAYAGAALRIADENPGCGLGWNTLAAIGHVESEHGTIDGSALDGDGRATPHIVGIPLDGGGVDAIRDSDDGALDGDRIWDRAVGPMQFIPSTWELFGADGDGDGVADPQQIDDAALAAAAYLCSITTGSLSRPENWIAAVAAYNSTIDYNNRVAGAAAHYASVG